MRNFSHTYCLNSVAMIDFLQSERELMATKLALQQRILSLMETSDVSLMSPSEERCMNEFLSWFHQFATAGARISVAYPRMSMTIDLPANTAYTYVNFNTGRGLTLIGMFADGYGDYTFGATVL